MATDGDDIEPDLLQAAVAAGYIGGLLGLGAFAGWRALILFTLAYAGAAAVERAFFWTDDPTHSGLEDFDPLLGLILVLPFALLVIAGGVVGRRVARRWRAPVDASGPS